jgi:D-alanine-D-alanine ligase
MNIGIAFDLKPTEPLPAGAPDDLHEEFDSPSTIAAIAEALREAGHTVTELGNGRPLVEALLNHPPDFVFNFAEGTGVSRNREARVPALCEMFDIPYTGSDALTQALALDKDLARRIVAEAGVLVPRGFVLKPPSRFTAYDGDFAEFPALIAEQDLSFPVIAKPTCEGSSKGIRNRCLIERAEDFGPTVAELWQNYRQPVLVEEFIAGDEVTVGIVGNDPPVVIGSMRVVPKQPTDRFIYSLEVKRNYEALVSYECPPRLPGSVLQATEEAALTAFDALGCRDVARLDFRIRDGVPYFLEANPLPGLNPITSDLVLLARAMSISHGDLVRAIFSAAAERYRLLVR